MSATAKRKLAAIVFADIAGYTDKTNRDEAGTLDVRGQVERLIKSSTLSHHGRIVKTLGDGAMLEFASAVEAVSAALDIQDQMEHLNRELELAEPMKLRVGVHVGDVVEENEDLYGNAVNIASRVHAMAQPGGICITREVYVQIRPILKLQCAPVAGTSTDRLPDKVEVFAILGEEIEGHAVTARKPSGSPTRVALLSVAALAVFVVAYALFNPFRDTGESPNVHRILLPDWVTPGEWFELDAGPTGSNLAVYFGNRRAQSEVVGERLRIRTPEDLPTAQTTISVFESGSSKPLLNQQTEVVRVAALASNTKPIRSDPIGGAIPSGPDIDIDAEPIKEKPPAKSGTAPAASPKAGLPPPPTGAAVSAPPSPTTPGGIYVHPVPGIGDYDKMMTSIGNSDFKFEKVDLGELKDINTNFGQAMRTITLAQGGNPEKAKQEIAKVRLELKGADPKVATECEALLKTAEAFIDSPAVRGQIKRMGPKWAQAFAFSINNGTRNLPGLAMIDRLIESGKEEDARRAIALLWERKDLTSGEKKVLERLQAKLKSKPDTSPGASVSGDPQVPQL